jgi:hypothetical protein
MHMGIYAYRTFVAGIVVIVCIVLGILWFSYSARNADQMATTTPISIASTTSTTEVGAISSVKIALLDTEGTTDGKSRGCDKVVLVDRQVAPTSAPLSAALKELFSISTTTVSGWFNFIDRTNETLMFDHVTVATGTANVYLTGELSGLSGVCDDPRTQIQIEETALQFPTVSQVKIFLNEKETNITPSQK